MNHEGEYNLLKAPIFVLGCHKSGTTLLCCLLDAHRDLFVLPLEMHLLQYSGYKLDYPLRREVSRRIGRDGRIEHMVRNLRRANRSGRTYGAGRLDGRIGVEAFESFLRQRQWSSDAEFFTLCLRAAHLAIHGRELEPRIRAVEKSVENAHQAQSLRAMFGDSRFVHIVRNPYATLVSIRKSLSRRGYPDMRRIVFSVRNSFNALLANERTLDGYRVIRYEDLVTDTERVMRDIAAFVEIAFEDVLLRPTRLGELWTGNSTSYRQFTGISTGPLENWRKDILPLEIALANRHLAAIFERFGYERLDTPTSGLLAREAGEGVFRWITNRMTLRG